VTGLDYVLQAVRMRRAARRSASASSADSSTDSADSNVRR